VASLRTLSGADDAFTSIDVVCLLVADVVVDRSTTGRISGGFNGNWADGIAAQGTGVDPMDEKNHLAKVRVAGSNPVVRSTESPGQRLFMPATVVESPIGALPTRSAIRAFLSPASGIPMGPEPPNASRHQSGKEESAHSFPSTLSGEPPA
jgi:hypothetical protein